MQLIKRRTFLAGCLASAFPMLTSRASTKTFDVVVYGATSGGITAAVEAKRQGCSVALVGGWRETHLGGMMSGGLGGTDINSAQAYGGLCHEIIRRIKAKSGSETQGFAFEPRYAELVFKDLVAEYDISVFWSKGVEYVRKDGTTISGFSTADGQSFTARVFVDATYEGDLLARAGVSYTIGRERRDHHNIYNGFRGTSEDGSATNHSFYRERHLLRFPPAGKFYVSPHNVDGVPVSGLLPGIKLYPNLSIGAADNAVQAYNFRMTMAREPGRRVPLPASPPDSYFKENYELLFRWIKALSDAGQLGPPRHGLERWFLLHNELGGGIFDINNMGPVSTDWIGGSWEYPESSYARREEIWKQHERWIRGFFYTLQHERDQRVPVDLRDCIRSYGLVGDHYLDPYPGDSPYWPYQLYVREARRMVSDLVLTGADLERADGTQPPSVETIATGSYARDSHHVQRLAVNEGDGWRVVNEGNFEVPSGGNDAIFPIPYGAVVPKRSECSNMLVAFCVSATHEAFGAIRMELTLMQLGQSIGMAAALLARAGREIAVQDIPYNELRSGLLSTPEKVKPNLPLIN